MAAKPQFSERTWEAISALQKCIRRGMELEAAMWFFELEADGHFHWALNRLRVIGQEDVGLADPEAVIFADRAADRAAQWHKGKNGAWQLAVANAILALCRASKSRLADHFQAVARGRLKTRPRMKVPDFALDKHTRAGKRLGRGFEHFRVEGAKLDRPAHGLDPYEEEAFRYWIAGTVNGGDADKSSSGKLFNGHGGRRQKP